MVEGRGVEVCFWRKLGGLFEVVEGVLSGGQERWFSGWAQGCMVCEDVVRKVGVEELG